MKYFYFVLTFVYAFAAVGNFYTAGHDPFMNIISFICLIGCGVFAWLTVWADVIHGKIPEHAVSDNEPEDDHDWEYIQRVPAYIRRG
jgi:ABC-type nickel/cobalt efflux system permease component RcnA